MTEQNHAQYQSNRSFASYSSLLTISQVIIFNILNIYCLYDGFILNYITILDNWNNTYIICVLLDH